MDYSETGYRDVITEHYTRHWGKNFKACKWVYGPMLTLRSSFEILEFKPSDDRHMWTYATCGMSTFTDVKPIELHIFSLVRDESLIELLTIVSHYHITGSKLNVNHTVNFGKAWLPESKCSYGLISLPYLDGPSLELLNSNGVTINFYWLIPITPEEQQYKKEHGVESLEQKFEEKEFNYLDVNRLSVVGSDSK